MKTDVIYVEIAPFPNVNKNIGELLEEIGAVLKGHFLLSSGLHSDTYIEKFRILERPNLLKELLLPFVTMLKEFHPEVVVGPTLGGAIIAYQLAELLGIKSYYAERGNGSRVFRRGFDFTSINKVLVADDILTTGGSIRQTLEAVKNEGAEPVAIFVLVNRSLEEPNFGIPLYSVYRVYIETYEPTNCPLCKRGISLIRPGGIKD